MTQVNCDWQWIPSSLTDKHAFNATLSHQQSDLKAKRDVFIRDVMTEVKFKDAYKAEVGTVALKYIAGAPVFGCLAGVVNV